MELFFLLLFNFMYKCLDGIPNGLTYDEKMILLEEHNKYRSDIANGKISEYSKGSNINELAWDDGLAFIAQDYSSKCIWRHNPFTSDNILNYQDKTSFIWDKRQSGTTNHFGENMYLGRSKVTMNELLSGLGAFFNEYKWWDYNTQKCVSGKRCGHFLQMISAQTRYIGCGYTFCDKTWKDQQQSIPFVTNRVLLVCNYWPSGWLADYPEPYLIGEPCSKCDLDRDKCINGLCGGCMSKYYHFCDKNLIGGCNNFCPRKDKLNNNLCDINSTHIDCLDCRKDCNTCSNEIKNTCTNNVNNINIPIPNIINNVNNDNSIINTFDENEFNFDEKNDKNNKNMNIIKCPSNKIYNECVNINCESNCFNRNPHCLIEKCEPGCKCDNELIWNSKINKCVPLNKCPKESNCLIKDQIYYECGPSCIQTCDNLNKQQICVSKCNPGCFCIPPLILYEGKCISKEECPKKIEPLCDSCLIIQNGCYKQTCNNDNTLLPINMNEITNINCNNNNNIKYCNKCRNGFLFKNNDGTCNNECNNINCGKCIPRNECWIKYNPQQLSILGSNNNNNINKIHCKYGQVYNECGLHPLCIPTCFRMNPKCQNINKCFPGCFCPINTYLYNGKCIFKNKCDRINLIRKNQEKQQNQLLLQQNINNKHQNCQCLLNELFKYASNINCGLFKAQNKCKRFRQCYWKCDLIE